MNTEFLGVSEFHYTREDVDEIFSWLLANGNSIATTYLCFRNQKRLLKGDHDDWLGLIEQCANSIRNGVTNAQEYWENLLERTQHHRITKKEIR